MTKISTLAELRAEQKKMHFHKIILESEIKKDFKELKLELEPLKLFTENVGNVLISRDNGILGNSVGFIADFITKKIILNKAGFFTRLIVPYLVKNTTSSLVENNKSKIVGWIGNVISKLMNKKTVEN